LIALPSLPLLGFGFGAKTKCSLPLKETAGMEDQ